jgi:NTE family protein
VLFQPRWIGGRPLLDGGILDRPGLLGIPAGERVLYHHLAARSPWRRRGSPALEIPARPDLAALVIGELPRVGPYRLAAGAEAFEAAYRAATLALDAPLIDGAVRI